MSRRRGRYAHLSGDWWRHKKVVPLSLQARGLLASLYSYVADQASDGAVPEGVVVMVCMGAKHGPLVDELVRAKLVTKDEDGLVLHDWAEHNITLHEWNETRNAVAERVRKHRNKSVTEDPVTEDVTGDVTRYTSVTSAPSNAPSNATETPLPLDIRTSGHQDINSSLRSERARPRDRFAESFERPTTPDAEFRREIVAAYERSTGKPLVSASALAAVCAGTPINAHRGLSEALGQLAEWAKTQGDPAAAVATAVKGFAGDAWARSKGWPLKALANDPEKYFRAPVGGFALPARIEDYKPTVGEVQLPEMSDAEVEAALRERYARSAHGA